MDYKYKPDGWLGIIVGTKFWIDFTERHKVDSNVDKLVKELGSRGKIVLGETIQGTECSSQIIIVCLSEVLFRLRFYAIRALLFLTDSNKTFHHRNCFMNYLRAFTGYTKWLVLSRLIYCSNRWIYPRLRLRIKRLMNPTLNLRKKDKRSRLSLKWFPFLFLVL